ncbi:PREDICTED: magnesium-dependent phosphatase 1-like isoform X2 [Branchiostoma belcheri]|uniref:Magnesium-dependent phosphatase 1-like isoform X2 n=1 Tax=Branchiostoma belcheri TaxID=7741 RepID=A0A6P5A232_BRABE|nr:PREDICTED: magnesium-dependent phosphatase 1-like isoform X2 [Branchiostoma belcheri]
MISDSVVFLLRTFRGIISPFRRKTSDSQLTQDSSQNTQGNTTDMASNFTPPSPKPELLVLDVDWTLWPFHTDMDVSPPFKKDSGEVRDSRGKAIQPFPDVPRILDWLKGNGYTLALASRTWAPSDMERLLILLDWNKYFSYKEIYKGTKTKHFSKFKQNSGVPYNKMLFFDDEDINIHEIGNIGVMCIFVTNGLNWNLLQKGLEKYAKERS